MAAGRSQSFWAIGLGMIAWSLLLFSPLAFVGTANAEASDVENWGTVIGIVSCLASPHPALPHPALPELGFLLSSGRLLT